MDSLYANAEKDGKKYDWVSSAQTAAKWGADVVRPSIMRKSTSRPQIRRTAYLDGLRGFAAFLVYIQHHELWPLRQIFSNRILENGYGFEGKYYFAALPFVRTFFTGGHFAVSVFFVISGYVLSAKPLALIHSGEYAELSSNLGSALFRRWIRLHVPIIIVTFIYMTLWHFPGIWTLSPDHKPTWWAEVWNWYAEFKNFSFVFRQGGEAWFTYNFPVWSIPIEFRGSIIVYTSLLAFSRATINARLWCEAGLIFYFLYVVDGWFGALFVAGMMLCELDLLARHDALPQFFARLKPWKKPIFYTLLLVSVCLSGVPSHINDMKLLRSTPGWYYLSFLKPEAGWDQKWFYLFWAAVCLIGSIPRIPLLKSFFELPFNQYLGRISFSLYLVHGPVLWILGDRLYAAVGWYREAHEFNIPGWVNAMPISKAGPLGLEPAFLVPQIILLPLTLWVSEIATRLCDEPSLRISRYFYERVLGQPKESGELLA